MTDTSAHSLFVHSRGWLLDLPRVNKRVILGALDFVFLSFALWFLFSLRYNAIYVPPSWQAAILFAAAPIITVATFASCRLYTLVTRHLGYQTHSRIVACVWISVLIWSLIVFASSQHDMPHSIIFGYGVLASLQIIGSRVTGASLLQSTGISVAAHSAEGEPRPATIHGASKLLADMRAKIALVRLGRMGQGDIDVRSATVGCLPSVATSYGPSNRSVGVQRSLEPRTHGAITSGHAHPAAKRNLGASAVRSKPAGKLKALRQRVRWKSKIAKHLQAAHEELLWIAAGQKASSNVKALGISKAFFINLNSRPDRLSHVKDQLKPCPWQHERVEAVRIQTNPEALGLRLIPQLQNRPHVLSIWLSHRKALGKALDADGDGPFIVLEDDIRIKSDFFNRPLKFRPGVSTDWEVIMLSPRYRELFPTDENGISVGPIVKKPFGREPILLKDARKKFICSGAHFCIFRDKDTIRSIISRMDNTNEKYHVDHFYVLETISYGVHFDSVGTAGLGSDQAEHCASVLA